ncbi:type IV secretion system protein [Psychrobacillus sp. FSL H8-0484]|uniref:type IV secretion system protein n=1 Tax=Psychrobacillus sp. FSL H8-0484 TaxID=2921390 RepID=UPI0030F8337C
MKKILVVGILIFFLFPSLSVYAEESTTVDKATGCGPFMTEEKKESIEKFKEKDASLQESYAVDLIETLWNAVGINTLDTLVFGNPYCIWFDKETELVYGTFPKEQKEQIIDPLFNIFTGFYVIAMILAIMIGSLKRAYEPLGGKKVAFTEDLYMYVGTTILLAGYWIIIQEILNVNWAIVQTFRDLLVNQGINLNGATIISSQDDFNFTDIIIILAEWILVLFLNFVYILRTFMIAILLGLGGLAIVSLLFETTRDYFKTWLQDFAGAVFMQAIHSFYLTIVLLFVSTLSGEAAVVFKLILLIMFIPLSTAIMNWMNLSSGALATSIGMSGVNSMAGAVRMAKMGKARLGNGKVGKSPDFSKLNQTRISTVASGANSKSWGATKSIFQKSGMLVGAAAGSVLGPGGMMLGSSIGGAGAGAMLQVPRNIAGGAKGAIDTIKQTKNAGYKNTMGNLQDRRNFFGSMGESIGAMAGKGELGRSLGHGFSGVSRQRLLNSSELGGLGGVTLSDIAQKYPEANIAWMQNNQGSGFYMNNGGDMSLVSPLGAADPSLAPGENRMIDFKSENQNATEMGENPLTSGYSLQRTSEPYIKDVTGNTFSDPRMKSDQLNPESYYASGMNGAENRTPSDRMADFLAPRHQGFV